MTEQKLTAFLEKETRHRTITMFTRWEDYELLEFEWRVAEGAPPESRNYSYWIWSQPPTRTRTDAGRQAHGSGQAFQAHLPRGMATVGEKLLESWSMVDYERYPTVPRPPEPSGIITEFREIRRNLVLEGFGPFEGSQGTMEPKWVTIGWTCAEGEDRSRDHYSILVVEPGPPLGVSPCEYWGTGHIHGDENSPLPIPERLWDLVEQARQDLLSGAEFQGPRLEA